MTEGKRGEPAKILDEETPVPVAWRPVFENLVQLIMNDMATDSDIPSNVVDFSLEAARQYVVDYGRVRLSPLLADTWATSVAVWQGDAFGECWQVLVDLQTHEEGRSDLVLSARVREAADDYQFFHVMVYMP